MRFVYVFLQSAVLIRLICQASVLDVYVLISRQVEPSSFVAFRQRGFRKEEEFEPSRKMCSRHKKNKAADKPAVVILSDTELSSILRRKSAEDGVSKYDASCLLDDLPGQDEVDKEIAMPVKGEGEVDETAEGMRRARARCRPLINLIYEATGYSFVSVLHSCAEQDYAVADDMTAATRIVVREGNSNTLIHFDTSALNERTKTARNDDRQLQRR